MYICICKSITDKTIHQKVAEGMSSMREMKQCLGVGSQCGRCMPAALDLLKRSLQEKIAPCQLPQQSPCTC
ncbi:(2Fe-2S)-binding protein [Craterilacuibacter sp.]|uniref:(2Fe-2S)-binding protein n=1 Tax=Craterilacuibacter sp. TaxID=2870909 RepID=UPI003F36215D